MNETVAYIEHRILNSEFTQHVVVNVAKLVNMQTDAELANSVRACNLINIDGMGVVLGARLLGHDIPERVAGVDLFHCLLEMSAKKGFPVFLLGAEADIVEKTAQIVENSYSGLKVAGFHHGYFWNEQELIVDKIGRSGAKLLFVAISSPMKENFINKWQDRLGVVFVMGVGGTFDVVAGKVNRAPFWMQKIGLEWLYRVIQEPKRMWKRYLVTNSKFAWLLLKELLKKWSFTF
jgi:N-acetylglucosaminyldiphosphoundecaprenol N-acetyl-beta-D-mannosaminyltransferase